MQSSAVTNGNLEEDAVCAGSSNPIPTTTILSLPSEILAEILRMIEEDDIDRWRGYESLLLGKICLNWRAIAWSTPSLWSRVDLYLSKKRYLVQTELLAGWLQRSKAVPLTIRIQTIYTEREYWRESKPMEMLKLLASHSWHWKNIYLCAPPDWDDDLQPVRDNVPLLETLHLERCWDGAADYFPSLTVFVNAPLLHDVHLIYTYFPKVTLPWHQITTFKANHLYVAECLTVLRHCYQMRECHFSVVTEDDEPLLPIGLTHKCLEWLEITWARNDVISLLLNPCTLPTLRRLECCGGHERIRETVSITSFIQRSGCILESLSFDKIFFFEEDAIVCLRNTPSVVELQIAMGVAQALSVKFLAAVTSPDTPLLPNLRSLTIQGYVSFNAEELMEMLDRRWARPKELSWPFSQLKSLTIISPFRSAENSRLKLSELVLGGLDLPLTCTYDRMDSHEQMVIRFAEGENIRYSS